MTDPGNRERATAVAELTREARDDVRASTVNDRVDWDALDEKLFARIDAEEKAVAASTRFRGSRAAWGVLGGVAAAAAAALLLFGRPHDEASFDALGRSGGGRSAIVAPSSYSKLARGQGGEAWVNGQIAASEQPIAVGDTVETRSGRATFSEARKVTWALDASTRVRVDHAGGPLVLALDHGAVEAQVAPVDHGEAFAVDIEGARVAVHGTHLRVERTGERVIVDLTEGVVSIGPAPRAGSTYGSLVTAPAHAEFDLADPRGTLRVTHDSPRVRSAIALPLDVPAAPAPATVALPPPRALAASPSPVVTPPAARAAHGGAVAAVSSAAAPSRARAATASSPEPALDPARVPAPGLVAVVAAAPVPAPPAAPPPRPSGTLGVAQAVKDCWLPKQPSSDVTVYVRTELTVETGEDGAVRTARFDPPLPPAVQACASPAIYATRFAGAGRIVMPIELTR